MSQVNQMPKALSIRGQSREYSADLVEGAGSLCGVWSAPCEDLHCPVPSLGYPRSKPVPAILVHLSCRPSSRTSFGMYSSFRTIGTLVFLQTGRFKARVHLFQAYVPGHGGAHCATQLLLSQGRNRQSFKCFPIILRSLPDLWIHTILIRWIRSN